MPPTVLLALALSGALHGALASPDGAGPSAPSVSGATAPAAASTPASTPPATPAERDAAELKTARDTLAQAQGVFAASCGERAYAAYDDICNQLGRQIRIYQLDVDRLARRALIDRPGR